MELYMASVHEIIAQADPPEPTHAQGMRLWSWGATTDDWTMQPDSSIIFRRTQSSYPMRAVVRPDGTWERLAS